MKLEYINKLAKNAESGDLPIGDEQIALLMRHEALVREWSSRWGLVSAADLDRLWENHISDSLSLAPVLVKLDLSVSTYLDIGSGGGYPAIPLKIVFPDLKLTLVERSEKRIGFLRKLIASLALKDIAIVHGEFPRAVGAVEPQLITGRAVEHPQKFVRAVLEYLPIGCVYLSQSGDPRELVPSMFHVERAGPKFHVEQIQDSVPLDEYRRGSLWLVKRIE